MKSLLPILLAAFALFGVSAAMSIWLYQSRPAETTEPEKLPKKTPGKDKDPDRAEKEPAEKPEPKTPAKEKDAGPPKLPESPALDEVRTREETLARRDEFRALVLRDLQGERDAVDALQRQVVTEVKAAAAQTGEAARATDADRKKAEADALEWKNIRQLAPKYEAMSAEAAAPIFRQMADSGRLEVGAKMLSLMKDRATAQILSALALSDPMLAEQYTKKILELRPPADKLTPAGGAGSPPRP